MVVLRFEFGAIEVNQYHLSLRMMSPSISKHGKNVEETAPLEAGHGNPANTVPWTELHRI